MLFAEEKLLQKNFDVVYMISGEKKLAVIANKNLHLKTISLYDLKMIFLKQKRVLNGVSLVPINLEALNPTRKIFEKEVLHLSRNRLKEYWTKKHYMGVRPPIHLKSAQSVLSFVTKVDGAIAYIPSNELYKIEDVKNAINDK